MRQPAVVAGYEVAPFVAICSRGSCGRHKPGLERNHYYFRYCTCQLKLQENIYPPILYCWSTHNLEYMGCNTRGIEIEHVLQKIKLTMITYPGSQELHTGVHTLWRRLFARMHPQTGVFTRPLRRDHTF